MKRQIPSIVRVLASITLTLSIVLLIKTVVTHPFSSDSFLHLAVGKHIAIFQKIPTHYDISYKTADISLEWMSYAWLSDLLLYGVTLPNPILLSKFLLIFCLISSLGLLVMLLRALRFSFIAQSITLSLLLFVLQIYWRIHPLLFITPLLLFTLIIFTRFSNKMHKSLLALPIVGLLWANMYGGYIFIFISFIISFLTWYIFGHRQQSRNSFFWIAFTIPLAVLTTFINPFTWQIYTKIYTFWGIVQLKRAFVNESNLLSLINQSFLLENVSTIPYAVHAALLIVAFVSITLLLIRRKWDFFKEYSFTLVTVPLLIFGFIFVRFIPLTMSAGAIFFCALIEYARPRLKYFDVALFAILVGAIPFLIYQLFFPLKLLTIHPPQKQIELILQHRLPNNVMTTSEYSGYAKYTLQSKLNIDLLDEMYDDAETLNVLLQSGTFTKETLKKILDAKHIATVLASKENGNFSRSMQISLKDEWALIYIDSNGALFVRRNKVSPEFLKRHEMRYLSLASTLGADKDYLPEATVELEYAIGLYPQNNLYRGQLATLYRIQKRPDKAASILYAIPQDQWNYKFYTEMGRAQASMGNCAEAEMFFQQALNDRTETNFSQAVLDLALIYVGCFQDKERARHYFERYLSFTIPHTEKEKARKLAEKFGIHIE